MMQKITFNVPALNHIFVDYTEKGPIYYRDKNLEEKIPDNSEVIKINTLLPENLSKIEVSKACTKFDSAADTVNYFHLWPFSHMTNAEIIIDGKLASSYSLVTDELKSKFRESLENINWAKSCFIIYQRNDKTKIGFLLFR